MAFRSTTPDEQRLLRELARVAGDTAAKWLETVRVREMNDGGMGSLALTYAELDEHDREFGKQLATVQFTDADGVEVVATLNGNRSGRPFELDVWKTDFSPLLRIPHEFRPTKE